MNAVLGSVGGELSTGMIVMPDPLLASFRATIIDLAARQRHPAIYPIRVFPDKGGLMSYGVDIPDQVRRRHPMSIAFSRARSRPTCRCRRRPSSSSSST